MKCRYRSATNRLGRTVRIPFTSHERQISNKISFRALNKTTDHLDAEGKNHQPGSFRVLLLKSPSHIGHFTSRVNRLYNEDKYSANVLTLNEGQTVFNFNIFDGHGGDQCSTFLQHNLSQEVESCDELSLRENDGVREELLKNYLKNIGGYWKRWYKHRQENFEAMKDHSHDIRLQNLEMPQDDYKLRVPMSFLKADYNFMEQDDNKSGSTCTSVFIETVYNDPQNYQEGYYFMRNTISKLTMAHVGDTRAILVDKNGEAHALSQDHHPSNPIEAKRLRKYSANFFMTDSFGEERFIALANTRAFGDLNYKKVGVSAEPDIFQLIIGDLQSIKDKLTPEEIHDYTIGSLGGDESFLVLCTDGVTGILTDQEIADIVMSNFNMKGHPQGTAQLGAEEIIKFVEYVGGDDNATCLVIRLNGWGMWPVIDRTGPLRQERMDDFSPRSDR